MKEKEYELILPIKKKWFDMILSGEKKEEYREFKEYYTKRFVKIKGVRLKEPFRVLFRNGYNSTSPSFIATVKLGVGFGKPEWGAIQRKVYYVLEIIKIEEKGGVGRDKERECMIKESSLPKGGNGKGRS